LGVAPIDCWRSPSWRLRWFVTEGLTMKLKLSAASFAAAGSTYVEPANPCPIFESWSWRWLSAIAGIVLAIASSQAIADPISYFSQASTTVNGVGVSTDTGQIANATAQSTNPITQLPPNSGGPPGSVVTATALADRTSGELHAIANCTCPGAEATATFGNTLTFTGTGPSTTVNFSATVTGTLTGLNTSATGGIFHLMSARS
jgi:hypothetical protein